MDLKVKAGQTFLCIGDSITDCGRMDVATPLGSGYVKMFSDLLIANFPEKKINIINKGIGGETIIDLKARWGNDVLLQKPDWLSVLIGINDAHRFIGGEQAFNPEEFFKNYCELLTSVKEKIGCPVVLLEPFFITKDVSNDFFKQIFGVIKEYKEAVSSASRKFKTDLVKLQDIFVEQLKYNDPDVFCPEPVHPNATGHMVIAQNLFNAIVK